MALAEHQCAAWPLGASPSAELRLGAHGLTQGGFGWLVRVSGLVKGALGGLPLPLLDIALFSVSYWLPDDGCWVQAVGTSGGLCPLCPPVWETDKTLLPSLTPTSSSRPEAMKMKPIRNNSMVFLWCL